MLASQKVMAKDFSSPLREITEAFELFSLSSARKFVKQLTPTFSGVKNLDFSVKTHLV